MVIEKHFNSDTLNGMTAARYSLLIILAVSKVSSKLTKVYLMDILFHIV